MPQSYNAFIFRLLKSNIAQDSKIRYTSIFNYNPLISIYYFHSMLIKVTDLRKVQTVNLKFSMTDLQEDQVIHSW